MSHTNPATDSSTAEIPTEAPKLEESQDLDVHDAVPHKTFEDLGIKQAIIKAYLQDNITQPTKDQVQFYPEMMSLPPQNFIFEAPKNTHTWNLYLLAALCTVQEELPFVQAIVVAPTRERANTIYQEALKLSRYTAIRVKSLIPHKDMHDDQFGEEVTHHLVISIPTSLDDYLQHEDIDFSHVRTAIFDEAEEVFNRKKENVLSHSVPIISSLPETAQIILFSENLDGIYPAIRTNHIPDALQRSLNPTILSLKDVSQYYVVLSEEERPMFIKDLFETLTLKKIVVFISDKESAEKLVAELKAADLVANCVFGLNDMKLAEFRAIIRNYEKDKFPILISTIPLQYHLKALPTLCINYSIPYRAGTKAPDDDAYLKRLGRSDTFGGLGVGLTCIDDDAYDQMSYFGYALQTEIKELADFDDLGKAIKYADTLKNTHEWNTGAKPFQMSEESKEKATQKKSLKTDHTYDPSDIILLPDVHDIDEFFDNEDFNDPDDDVIPEDEDDSAPFPLE
ncbi:putative ATP-dependent RNA helicase DBP5 [Blattamonas nauphoetae]|uniref:ATP-dependent RNA helicase n=1 Tax=Blattamonas nauphoetae TaxID=2049346 RepID=A0ABQ9Y2L5_9EUKA|nr:putative ATP-dependent RNA helicase DBP5 [Blattamonas nauphoetae]